MIANDKPHLIAEHATSGWGPPAIDSCGTGGRNKRGQTPHEHTYIVPATSHLPPHLAMFPLSLLYFLSFCILDSLFHPFSLTSFSHGHWKYCIALCRTASRPQGHHPSNPRLNRAAIATLQLLTGVATADKVWALASTEWNCVCAFEIEGDLWCLNPSVHTTLILPVGSQSQGCSKSPSKAWEGGQPVCSCIIQPDDACVTQGIIFHSESLLIPLVFLPCSP
jgi:hypothetical protein